MGQFYKGAEATFLDDAMFKLPYEQMQNALKEKDTAIGNTIQSAIKLGDFDVVHHAIDKEDAARLKQEWDNKIQTSVDQILVDPLNYKRVQGDIISMGRDLNKDIKFGDISVLAARKAQIDDYQKGLEELYKKDPEKYAHEAALYAKELQDAKAATYKNAETGDYNYFSGQELYAAPPITGVVEEAIKNATGKDFENLTVTENGQWKITRGGKTEGWSQDRIKKIVTDYINASPVLLQGYAQSAGLGVLPTDIIEQGLEYAKEKYKIVQTSSTKKDELGDEQKLEIAYNFNKKKENEEQVIINTENVQSNLVNTYNTYISQVGNIRKNLDAKKVELAEIWNRANPKNTINPASMTTGAIIEKLKILQATDPKSYNFTAEIQALKNAAIRNQTAASSYNNYTAYLKQNKLANTQEAFKAWHDTFSNAKPGSQAYQVRTGVDATFQGTGLGTKEIESVQSTANANKLIMPFQLKGFSLPTVATVGGKERKVILQFPTDKNDPIYRELLATYKAAKRTVGKGVNYIVKDGKTYGVDLRMMDKGGTAIWEDLAKLGHVKAKQEAAIVATPTASGALNVAASGGGQQSAPGYFIAGTGKAIDFEPTTFVPVKGVNHNNETYYQGTWRTEGHPIVLNYESSAKNVPTNNKLNTYLDNNRSSYSANKSITQFGGTGNLDGKVELGSAGTLRLENGVIYHKGVGKAGEAKVAPGNANYESFLSTYMEQKALQSK
jgi:hypothetical protein